MYTITRREVIIIGVRLVVIYFILQLLESFVVSLATILLPGQSDTQMKWALLIGWGSGLVFSVLCWIVAPKIAGIIVRPDVRQSVQPPSDLQTSLFRAIGMWIFITTLPQLISLTLVFIHNSSLTMPVSFISRSLTLIGKSILSLCLILSAPVLTQLLKKLRYGSAT